MEQMQRRKGCIHNCNRYNLPHRAMTFYVGRQVFEVQRGWVVNLGGEKFLLEEGDTSKKAFYNYMRSTGPRKIKTISKI